MKNTFSLTLFSILSISISSSSFAKISAPIEIEAEHFIKQEKHDLRKWVVFDGKEKPAITADPDSEHRTGASGGAYIELLPDTRVVHADKLTEYENFAPVPGRMAVLTYKVKFPRAGKYFVWVRAYSSGSEDNGAHIGLNGTWPETSARVQLCEGKNRWTWSSQQRRATNHCGDPKTLWLDIPKAGTHQVQVSMREDGFELDKLLFTQDESYEPEPPLSKPQKEKPSFAAHQFVSALEKFSLKSESAAKFYKDEKNSALAINAAIEAQRNQFAVAEYRLSAADASASNLALVTLLESDGESEYQVRLGDKLIGVFQNSRTTTDYQEQYFVLQNQQFKEGDVLRVESKAVTNGKVPEGDGTAYSRGRWRGIALF